MPHRIFRRRAPATLSLVLALVLAPQARAELYKCRQPDGRILYQQTACGGHADAATFSVDVHEPRRAGNGRSKEDYSIAGQAAAMRAERERLDRARLRARREAAASASRASARSDHQPDRAKCAKHRAEVARWKAKVIKGYHKRSEKDFNEGKLEYHQTLVERYCE